MGDRAGDILRVETAIETDAFGELLDAAVRSNAENAGSGWGSQSLPRCVSSIRAGADFDNLFMLNSLDESVNEPRNRLLSN
jgi:hypothetical protein